MNNYRTAYFRRHLIEFRLLVAQTVKIVSAITEADLKKTDMYQIFGDHFNGREAGTDETVSMWLANEMK
jgi:hypothetical protein